MILWFMNITANLAKDVSRVESYLGTDIANIGLWNSEGLSWISSPEIKSQDFDKYYTEGNTKTEGQIIASNIGSDGNFKIILNLNQGLSEEDKKNIYKSEKSIILNVTGKIIIGSTEWVGYNESGAISRNMVDTLTLTPGQYIVDTYSLLIKDQSGNPKYIQLVFCIFTLEKYVKSDVEPRAISKVLALNFTR